ncbi:unknown [Megasphaera elsdenii CAG:570]|uniref:Uncharacterized protein n=1 Tax=Megasphaera elsdenii CAG:570 TaxID=1263087 RepID=R7MXX4_MEGEL|nr:unknown [Megasphaera elsdenii CAG:570]
MDSDVLVIAIALDRQTAVIHGRVACRNGFSFNTVDAFKVLGQFDLQFGIITILRSNDTDIVTVSIFRSAAVNLDILVQFHRCLAGIAAVLHAIVHGSHFMSYMVVVFVYDAVHAVFATMAVGTIDTDLAILDMDISRCVLTIFAGRTRQANVAFRTILTVDTLDGDTIFAIFTFDGNAILAINADAGLAISPIDTHMAILSIFTVFASTTDVQVIAELQIINLLAIRTRLLSNLKVAICVGAVRFRSRTAIDGDFRMMLVDLIDLRVHISNLLVDIRLNLMELILCSSTAADIGTIILPGLVVQVGDILASLVGLARSLAILIIDGQAAIAIFDVANLDAIVAASDNLALRAIDSDLVVACTGRNRAIGAADSNCLVTLSGIAKSDILGQVNCVLLAAIRICSWRNRNVARRTSFHCRMLFGQILDVIKLAAIDSILGRSTDFTVGYIRDFLTAAIDTRIGDARTIFNLEARAVHYSRRRRSHITILRRCRIGSTVETCQVLIQLDQQFTVFAFLIGYTAILPSTKSSSFASALTFPLMVTVLFSLTEAPSPKSPAYFWPSSIVATSWVTPLWSS